MDKPYLRLGKLASLRLWAIPKNQSLYIVCKGEVDSISLKDKALFKFSRDFKSNGRTLFHWMNYWTPLIPFHIQMLAEDSSIDEQGYKRYCYKSDW